MGNVIKLGTAMMVFAGFAATLIVTASSTGVSFETVANAQNFFEAWTSQGLMSPGTFGID